MGVNVNAESLAERVCYSPQGKLVGIGFAELLPVVIAFIQWVQQCQKEKFKDQETVAKWLAKEHDAIRTGDGKAPRRVRAWFRKNAKGKLQGVGPAEKRQDQLYAAIVTVCATEFSE